MKFDEGRAEIVALVEKALSEREPEDRYLGSVDCAKILPSSRALRMIKLTPYLWPLKLGWKP